MNKDKMIQEAYKIAYEALFEEKTFRKFIWNCLRGDTGISWPISR